MKTNLLTLLIVAFLLTGFSFGQKKGKQKILQGKICGNPNIKCKTDELMFADWDIQFEIPKNYVVYESEKFYAIILRSQKVTDRFSGDETCKAVATEAERLNIQKLFPNNKVFAQNCGAGAVIYSEDTVFLAVFAGKTLVQAKTFLKIVNKKQKIQRRLYKKSSS